MNKKFGYNILNRIAVCILCICFLSTNAHAAVTLPYTCTIDSGQQNTKTILQVERLFYKGTSVTSSFSFWGIGGATRTLSVISDNQNISSSERITAITALTRSLNIVASHKIYNARGANVMFFSLGTYPDSANLSGDGIPSFVVYDPLKDFVVPTYCSGYTNCIQMGTPSGGAAGVFNYTQSSYPSFGTNFYSPVSSQVVYMTPGNEYVQHEIIFRDSVGTMAFGIAAEYNPVITWGYSGDTYLAPTGGVMSYNITCKSTPTPLTLTLDKKEINFDSIPVGSVIPISRELGWSASGTGQAGIWTLTFDSDTKDGDNILLGSAKVSLLDISGNKVPLNSPVSITGVTGKYTLELDPSSATAGEKTAELRVTLTAN